MRDIESAVAHKRYRARRSLDPSVTFQTKIRTFSLDRVTSKVYSSVLNASFRRLKNHFIDPET